MAETTETNWGAETFSTLRTAIQTLPALLDRPGDNTAPTTAPRPEAVPPQFPVAPVSNGQASEPMIFGMKRSTAILAGGAAAGLLLLVVLLKRR